MEPKENQQLRALLDNILAAMSEYMEEEGVKYKKRHIRKCSQIVKLFLEEISATHDRPDGLLVVQDTIEQLNLLNQSCRTPLIETMEREDLCEIINTACVMKGYSAEKEDVTEVWREW